MIDFFWLMFESLVTIFQAFIIVWFTTGFLESKYENPMRSLAFWITDLVLTAAILIANAFTVFEGPAILIYCIILFVYALLFLQGTILKNYSPPLRRLPVSHWSAVVLRLLHLRCYRCL